MSKPGIIIATVAFVIVVGVGIGLLGSKRNRAPADAPADPAETVAAETVPPPAVPREKRSLLPRERPAETGTNGAAIAVPAAGASTGMTNWEDKLDEILTTETTSDAQKVQQMAAIFPTLAPDAQEEMAQHMANLTPDEQYGLGQYLTNAALPEAVLEVFLADVLNRPNTVKMPLLLDIAQNQQHPGSSEARDLLELFLEEDYGNDWNLWRVKMQEWLKENPED